MRSNANAFMCVTGTRVRNQNTNGRKVASILLLILMTCLGALRSEAQVSHLVISQVNGGGGTAGNYTRDIVELFNPTGSAISINGWSIQYASAAGTSFVGKVNLPNVSINPGRYYLVAVSTTGAAGTSIAYDLQADGTTGSFDASSSTSAGGRIALVNSTTTLGGSTASSGPTVVDFIGWGTAATYETAAAPSHPAVGSSLFRKNNGCTDADNNSTDWITGTIGGRTSASAANYCYPTKFATTTPSGVTTGTGFSITVSSNNAGASAMNVLANTSFTITNTGGGTLSGTTTGTISAGTSSVTVSGIQLSAAGSATLTITRSSGDNLTAVTTSSFTVTAGAAAPTLTSPTVASISDAGATLGANITNYNGSNATQYGTIYSTTDPGPNFSATIGNNPSTLGANSTTGAFIDARTGLSAQTQYFYAGYATNGTGTGFSPKGSFYTFSAAATSGASNFTATPSSFSQINLSWTAASFPGSGASNNGYIILRRSDATNPDGTNVVNGVAPGSLGLPSGTTLVTTVLSGATTSFANGTGLSASTQYNYVIIPFTWDGSNNGTYNYLTSGAQTANATTLAGAPTISTTAAVTGIGSAGGTSGGSGIADGGSAITERGIVWNTGGTPTTADAGTNVVTGTDPFTATLAGLTPQTRYFVRAYVINPNGTAYGSEVNFRTFASAPTGQASGFTASVTANASGSVTLNWTAASFPGGATPGYVLAYGSSAPSFVGSPNGLAPASAVASGTPVTLGNVITATVSGLTPGTTYNFLLVPYTWDGTNTTTNNYLTASAPTTSIVAVGTPTITTGAATVTGATTATASASGISAASGTVSQKGIVYAKASTSTNPTLALNDGYTTEGGGTAAISNSNLGTGVAPATALAPQTQYYYNGYATNEAGTGYGTASSFRTWSAAPTTSAGTLGASAANATQVNLTWTAATFPSAANATVGGYLVFRSSGANAVAFTLTPGTAPAAGTNTTLVATISTQATNSYSNTGVSPTTTYNYVVIPFTWDGANASTYNYNTSGYNTASATTPVGTSATDAFRTRATGDWSNVNTWSSFTSGSWIDATSVPTTSAASILIQSSDSVTITGSLTINKLTVEGKLNANNGTFQISNGTGADLTVATGGILYVNTATTFQGATDITIAGTLNNSNTLTLGTASTTLAISGTFNQKSGGSISNGSSAPINVTGTYNHAQINGAIPTANWLTGSTLAITGTTATLPTNMAQTVYNFTYNATGQSTTLNLTGNNFPTTVNGDFSILSTGTRILRFTTNTAYSISITGNLNIGVQGSGSTDPVVAFTNGTGVATFNVEGNMNIFSGNLDMTSSSSTPVSTFNLSGDFNFTGGVFDASVSGSFGQINFVKAFGIQKFNQNGGSFVTANSSSSRGIHFTVGNGTTLNPTLQLENNITFGNNDNDFLVKSGSTIDLQDFFITQSSGTGCAFDLNSGARLMTSFANGVSVSGQQTAAIRVSGPRTLSSGASYTLYGTSAITSANLPSTVASLTIDNSAGVTSGSALSVTGGVVLTSGTVTMGSNNLTVGGSISRTSGNIDAGSNTVTLNGGSAQTVAAGSFLNNTTRTLIVNGAGVTFGGNHTVSTTLTLTAGSLSYGTNTFSYAGTSLTRTNGTINAATGTLAFTGTTAVSVPSGTIAGNIAHLTIDNSAAAPSVTFNASRTITGTLALTQGRLTFGSNTLTLQGAVTRGTGTLDASNTTLVLNGSSLQDLPAGTFSGNIAALTLNNAAGAALNQSLTITTLVLTSGKLDIGSNTVAVPVAGVPAGSSGSYVLTSGASGGLMVNGITAAGKTIPVGNSRFNPVTIADAATQNWLVRVQDAITNVTAPLAANVDRAVSRMWDLTPSLGSPLAQPATVTFQYSDATDVGSSFAPGAKVRVWHYEDVNGTNKWMAVSGYITPSGTPGAVRTVSVSGLSTFSPYALSNFDAPLPVTLLSFTGKRNGTVNELKWKTASESNSRGFAVERSSDGVTFTQVTFVPSRANGGNSTSDISYAYSDASAGSAGQGAANKWYYRLKQVDLDGQYKYSAVVLLKGDKSGFITVEGIYPNPVKA
ncbi:MAG: hypothetical protein EOO12_00410, partial [Chitinophagaceae bacterium]